MIFGHPTLEQLRLLPDEERVDWLRAAPEGQWLERKGPRARGKALADVMIGFANAEGGLVCIGLEDGRVEGVDGAGRLLNEWRQAAIYFTVPPVRHSLDLLACANSRGDADHVVVVEVEASERVHENTAGETFLRVGDENRRLGPFEAQELHYDKGDSTFDARPLGDVGQDALDQGLVRRYLTAIRAVGDGERALKARGLIAQRQGALVPTVAGILVLGSEPQAQFPEAHVRLLRYRGTSRETGSRSNVAQDVRLAGPIPTQLDAARRRLARWLPTVTRLGDRGRFGQQTHVPQPVWIEAVVNAAIHRSYAMGGDHIRVEVFDDRIDVESPGRLPGLVRVDNIRTTRFARNPRIARAMADLGFGRELGEGVSRMYQEMERAGLPDPVFVQTGASVRVTFLDDPIAARMRAGLPPGSERFVEHLLRTGRMTTSDAIELLGVSRPTAIGYLRRLEEGGFIEAVRTSPKDPRGFWRLTGGAAQRR